MAHKSCSKRTTAIRYHLQQNCQGNAQSACMQNWRVCSTAERIQSPCMRLWTVRCFTAGSCHRGAQQLEVLHAYFAAHLQASARAQAPALPHLEHLQLQAAAICPSWTLTCWLLGIITNFCKSNALQPVTALQCNPLHGPMMSVHAKAHMPKSVVSKWPCSPHQNSAIQWLGCAPGTASLKVLPASSCAR